MFFLFCSSLLSHFKLKCVAGSFRLRYLCGSSVFAVWLLLLPLLLLGEVK